MMVNLDPEELATVIADLIGENVEPLIDRIATLEAQVADLLEPRTREAQAATVAKTIRTHFDAHHNNSGGQP